MPTTRERLLALVRAEPHLNQTELAERLGVTRQRVKQLVDDEGLAIDRGPRGAGGRKPKVTEPTAPSMTGGVAAMAAGTTPAVAVFLAAADLTSRGYTVFLPVTQTASCDLVAIDRDGQVERIVVRRARRAGEEVRYDDPIHGRHERKAMILTDEPVRYEPALSKQRKG